MTFALRGLVANTLRTAMTKTGRAQIARSRFIGLLHRSFNRRGLYHQVARRPATQRGGRYVWNHRDNPTTSHFQIQVHAWACTPNSLPFLVQKPGETFQFLRNSLTVDGAKGMLRAVGGREAGPTIIGEYVRSADCTL